MLLELTELRGKGVVLEPVEERHQDELRQLLNRDEEGWDILPRSALGESFPAYWRTMTATPGRRAYAVRQLGTGELVGTSSYIDIDPANATLEIGATWFRPEQRGTVANPETKLLMLGHAFGAQAERVQFKVDSRNARSLGALAKLGAIEEGVIRKHMVTWTGFRRDSVLLSILAEEWPSVRGQLLKRVAALGLA